MIRARSRHLKCTACDKALATSIKIVAGDWLKSQNLTKNGLKFTFYPLNLQLRSVKSFKILFSALFFFNTNSNFALRM